MLKVIVENVVTCFLLGHSVLSQSGTTIYVRNNHWHENYTRLQERYPNAQFADTNNVLAVAH